MWLIFLLAKSHEFMDVKVVGCRGLVPLNFEFAVQ